MPVAAELRYVRLRIPKSLGKQDSRLGNLPTSDLTLDKGSVSVTSMAILDLPLNGHHVYYVGNTSGLLQPRFRRFGEAGGSVLIRLRSG